MKSKTNNGRMKLVASPKIKSHKNKKPLVKILQWNRRGEQSGWMEYAENLILLCSITGEVVKKQRNMDKSQQLLWSKIGNAIVFPLHRTQIFPNKYNLVHIIQ